MGTPDWEIASHIDADYGPAQFMDFSNPHEWMPWADIDFDVKAKTLIKTLDIPSRPGVYVLATNRTLMRAWGRDPNGILDIGESKNLKERIGKLMKTTQIEEWWLGGHGAGMRMRAYGWDAKTLRIKWRVLPSKNDAAREEGWLLKQYIGLFHEQPPLNLRSNHRIYEGLIKSH